MRAAAAIALAFLACAHSVCGLEIGLAWNHRTYIEEDVSRYRIYWGQTSHASVTSPTDQINAAPYENVVDVLPPLLHYRLNLSDGAYYFRILAVRDDDPKGVQFSDFNEPEVFLLIQNGEIVPLFYINVAVEVGVPGVVGTADLIGDLIIQYGGE